MEKYTKEAGHLISEMDMAKIYGKEMAIRMRDSGKTVKERDMGGFTLKMVLYLMVSTKMIKSMDS